MRVDQGVYAAIAVPTMMAVAFATSFSGEFATRLGAPSVVTFNCPTDCSSASSCQNELNAIMNAGSDIELVPGQTCYIDGPLIVKNTFGSSGTAPDAIISTGSHLLNGGAIFIQPGAAIHNVDIRGPYYGQGTGFMSKSTIDAWAAQGLAYYGVNGSASNGWSIAYSKIRGFAHNGVHAAHSEGINIWGNEISYNGMSGVFLYRGDYLGSGTWLGSLADVSGNQLVYNGEDGLDANYTSSFYGDNEASYNGWLGVSGDQNGILLYGCLAGTGLNPFDGVVIDNNTAQGNAQYGIILSAGCSSSVTGVIIRNNTVRENYAGGGIWFSGSMSSIQFNNNTGYGPYTCWNYPYSGVSGSGNVCN